MKGDVFYDAAIKLKILAKNFENYLINEILKHTKEFIVNVK